MSEYLDARLINPQQGHTVLESAWRLSKAHLTAGRSLRLTLTDAEDEKSAKQRRYYHGVILKEIAQKAGAAGQKFPLAVWKEHFRREYLPDKRKRVKNPINGKTMLIRVRQSTEGLSVKKYAMLIEKVTAYAVTELGVEFSERNFDRWSDVDPETGEVFKQ
jgi:NinB protein